MRRLRMLVAGLALLAANSKADAQFNMQTPSISVNGSAQELVKPEALRFIMGVQNTGTTHIEAMNENSRRTKLVNEKAKELGIQPADLFTARIELNANNSHIANKVEYIAANLVSVILRDVDKAVELVAALISAGANRVVGVRPILKRDDALVQRLRAQAIQKAKDVASQSATEAGVKLGKLLSFNSYSFDWNALHQSNALQGFTTSSAPVPIELGVHAVTVQVNMSWAIE